MKEVSRSNPCPICGKPDWCVRWMPTPGETIIVCKRSEGGIDVTGCDGRVYKFRGFSKDEHNAKYQLYEEWELQHEEWLRENGYGKYRDKKAGYDRWYGANSRSAKKLAEMPKKKEYEVVDPVTPVSHRELDRFYRTLLDILVLDPIHQEYLLKEGWTRQLIETSLVKSFPAKDVVRFNHEMYKSKNYYRKRLAKTIMERLHLDNLRGYPGAYIDHGGNWTLNGPSGIALPIYDADGYIYGIRIRMDFCDIDRTMEQDGGLFFYEHDGIRYIHQPLKGFYHLESGEVVSDSCNYWNDRGYHVEIKGKYRPLTSYLEDAKELENGRIVNKLTSGCQAENGISVYFDPKKDSPVIAYFTEGEKKGIYANHVMNTMIVTFPGVGSWRPILAGEKGHRMIDQLRQKGVQVCIVAYDADKATNAAVLRQQGAVAKVLLEEGFQVGLAEWQAKYGKGLDDLLAGGFFPGYEVVNID